MLSKTQQWFSHQLLQPSQAVPSSAQQYQQLLRHYSPPEAQARLAIYQNNFYRSLIDVLTETFASIYKLVGKPAFEYLAKQFIRAHPPRNATLSLYGDAFPHFLSTQQVAQQLPYLADCAALEWALHSAYYSKDAAPVPAQGFADIDPQQLMQCQLEFHPATSLLQSRYAIFSIYEFTNSDQQEQPIQFHTPENVFVCRNHYAIDHYLVDDGTSVFLDRLMQRNTLELALGMAMEHHTAFDASQALSFLIQAQAVITIQGAK